MTWLRRFMILLLSGGVVAAIALAMRPRPVPVDVATIGRGPLIVTISDDGRTRIRERYVVSAPLSGRLIRIALDPGDEVVAGETLLTTIEPTDPALLDPRAVALAEARVRAAEARANLAKPRLASAKETLNLEETEYGRLNRLQSKNAVSAQQLDKQRAAFRQAENDYSAASFEVEIAEFELQQAEAALLRTGDKEVTESNGWSFPITSPISGRVLRVFQESSTIINAGERILELGDPTDLEVEVDVLSTDAVKIQPGARVILNQWGGEQPLDARVRLIEPAAFTKVSALGIEEQRVNVIIDFASTEEVGAVLGDGFRVEADIVRWESDDVLIVPTAALFRESENWAVFVIFEGKASLRHVELGHRNDNAAEILDGLQPGDEVILYPGDRVDVGTLVQRRSE
ncbi:MAG: HlyD family efflux transporter periplasmic adaptor subunit [Planctomycetaceae bacterium]